VHRSNCRSRRALRRGTARRLVQRCGPNRESAKQIGEDSLILLQLLKDRKRKRNLRPVASMPLPFHNPAR